MASAKAAISFGLVHIPIELNPVVKNNDAAFNMLHKKCGSRIKQQKVCPHCETEVKPPDIIKGYEYTPDHYVTFTDEDFAKLKLANDKNIEIIAFVDLKEIDPIYYEKSYYLSTKTSNKAFNLFKKALNKAGKVAVAKTVLGTKFYYVVLRFGKNNILMNTLYFDEEIYVEADDSADNFTKEELEMANRLIEAMSDKFKPEKYKDEYQTRIKEAIDKKIKGQKIVKAKVKKTKSVADLMTALQKSVEQAK